MFAGPLKPASLSKWKAAPAGTLGLVAPFVLTHRKAPPGEKLWEHDATTGDFRISKLAAAALETFKAVVADLEPRSVIFRSPDSLSPSASNRDQLKKFFAELANEDNLGEVERVWLPGGLWEVRSAAKLCEELGITLAFDPLVEVPGDEAETYEGLEVSALYLRPQGARTGTIRNEKLEDLAALIESYEGLQVTLAFASPERWADARNFVKLLEG